MLRFLPLPALPSRKPIFPRTAAICALAGEGEGAVESAPLGVTLDARDGACRREPRAVQPPEAGEIIEIPQVGGLHHHYERRTA